MDPNLKTIIEVHRENVLKNRCDPEESNSIAREDARDYLRYIHDNSNWGQINKEFSEFEKELEKVEKDGIIR